MDASSLVLIIILACSNPVGVVGWGPSIGVPPFYVKAEWVEQDETMQAAISLLNSHPDTLRASHEVIEPEERKYVCGTGT